ncbi:MAG: YrdB family protein [Acidobacteria bacterium]|nr:YrdB family protein [Acidobacteriota bacterium]
MFGFHPANLAFRFVLEIVALIAIGVGAYSLVSGILAWILAIGLPLVAAVSWGTFNVPGDRSRSGKAPIEVPGVVRLTLELVVFLAAVVLFWSVSPIAATVLGIGVLIHYLLSTDRIRWLLAN